jgi:hypothetical protein
MSERPAHQSAAEVLDGLTLAMVVGGLGTCTDEAVADLRRYVQSKDIIHAAADFDASLDRAKRRFAEGAAHFFLCDGVPCQRRRRFEATAPALQHEAERIDCPISLTACQGPCKQAPIAALRVGKTCEMFAQFAQPRDWQAILAFAGRASRAGTMLVDVGTAQPFHFDPVHDHEKTSAALDPLRFLVGHFEGSVELHDEQRSIHKEVVGTWEAGGRFVALRMAAAYRRFNGHSDRHQALVIIGPDWEKDGLLSRAYTDSGMTQDFHLDVDGQRVLFADRVPHGVQATAARKVLAVAEHGYDESLEIDRGLGRFDVYYTLPMRRKT